MNGDLYIENQKIDLSKGGIVALNFAVNSLYEMKSVQGGISNKVTLPMTADNLRACGFAADVNADIRNIARKKLTCRYVQNGVEVIPEGSVEITGFSDKGLEVFISFGNTDFFDLIPGKLTDLEFPECDHVFNLAGVIAASLDNSKGFTYPVIDYGQFSLNPAASAIDVRYLRPAVYVYAILNKIVQSAGYTLDNLIGDGETGIKTLFDNLILPFSADSWTHGPRYLKNNSGQNVNASINTTKVFDQGDPKRLKWDVKAADTAGLFSLADGIYTSNKTQVVNLNINFPVINVHRPFLAGREGAYLYLRKNEEFLSEFHCSFTRGEGKNNQDFTDQSFSISDLALKPGDTIYVDIAAHQNSTVKVQPGATFKVELSASKVVFGQSVYLDGILPDLAQKDFLKAISALFCCIIQADNKNKRVSFVPFAALKQNIDLAKNWSEKISGKEPAGVLSIGDYAQNNRAKYKKDDNVLPETYGFGNLIIADENLDAEKELFELPFSASIDTVIMGGLRVLQMVKAKELKDPNSDYTIRTEPRIAVINRSELNLDYTDSLTTTPVSGAIPLSFFSSGNTARLGLMLNELITSVYRDLSIVLNDQRRITISVRLDEADIAELDFFKPVYIARFGAYFYISKISDYTGGKPCKVDLIKLY